MSEADLLVISQVGNQKHYQANRNSPVFMELSGLVRKTFGLADVLRQALLPVADHLKVALIYGSIAKGHEHAGSDVDLLLISDTLAYAELFALMAEPEAQLGRPINPSVYSAVCIVLPSGASVWWMATPLPCGCLSNRRSFCLARQMTLENLLNLHQAASLIALAHRFVQRTPSGITESL